MNFIADRIRDVFNLATGFSEASPIMKISTCVAGIVTTYGISKGLITADQTALYGSMAAGILGIGMLGFLNQEQQKARASLPAPSNNNGPG